MKNQQKLHSASEIDLKSQFATFDGIATKGDNAIVKRIMPFQGFQVMLDYDLAELYGVETKQLKRQVKRNMRRFPSDFMIEISERDMKSLRWRQIRRLCIHRAGHCHVVQHFAK